MKNQRMFLICSASIVLVCCFLTFGVTRAYYTEKQGGGLDEHYGTYSATGQAFTYLSISPSGDAQDSDRTGQFGLFDEYAKAIESGSCTLTGPDMIKLYKSKRYLGTVCVVGGKVYYIAADQEPAALKKVGDDPM
ncbi:hypothetical protein [Eubacterium sp. AB3007]|uniref:hypothetical protein n=1 Tax=Eubacterium sp. AB3007 TaxID=1392487 RepID=UPI00163998C1|nr:hypothetical protein [Eubacterium sp. AB3007]